MFKLLEDFQRTIQGTFIQKHIQSFESRADRQTRVRKKKYKEWETSYFARGH